MLVRREAGLIAQRSNLLFQHSAQCLVVVTWKARDSKERGLDLSMEPSIPLITVVPRGGQMERLRGKGRGLTSALQPCMPPVNPVQCLMVVTWRACGEIALI